MYENFTDRARKVMKLAATKAYSDSRSSITTRDILAGLLLEGTGVAAPAPEYYME